MGQPAHHCSSLARQSRSSLPGPSPVVFLLCQEDGRVADARRRAPATSCFAVSMPPSSQPRARRRGRGRANPPSPWPFSPLPPRSSPEQRAVAAVHRTQGHRPPLALPLSLEAPPRLPCPLHRATRRRRPCSSPPSSSSPTGTEDRWLRFTVSRPPPSPLTCSASSP